MPATISRNILPGQASIAEDTKPRLNPVAPTPIIHLIYLHIKNHPDPLAQSHLLFDEARGRERA